MAKVSTIREKIARKLAMAERPEPEEAKAAGIQEDRRFDHARRVAAGAEQIEIMGV